MFNKLIRKPRAEKLSWKREQNYELSDTDGNTGISSFQASIELEQLPFLRDVAIVDHPALLHKKLNLCSIIFDFSDHRKNAKEKDMKKKTLLELLDYVSSGTADLSNTVLEDYFCMISANLFRSLPILNQHNVIPDTFDAEEDELCLAPSWEHLQYVYELLLQYLVLKDTDAKVAKKYIDHLFVLRLLDLFDSDDPRERDYLKTILHRIYGKFMVHRPFIRKAINNIFYHFIFETEKHNGIGELLEILGSIINGFALPLKEEHKLFLMRALIPLHKPKCLAVYHQQLSNCVVQFVEKDFKLADIVIQGLIKYWPATDSQKEVLFLGELEEVLEATHPIEFQKFMIPLFKKISHSLNSSHFQVSIHCIIRLNINIVIMTPRQVFFGRMFYYPLLDHNILIFCVKLTNRNTFSTSFNMSDVYSRYVTC